MPSCSCGWLCSGTVRARLEADEVEHRSLAEERLAGHAGRELEGADGVEADELRFHPLDYRWLVTAVELPLLRSEGYVDGKWVDADSGATFSVANAATAG